jgi:hypothetical protein
MAFSIPASNCRFVEQPRVMKSKAGCVISFQATRLRIRQACKRDLAQDRALARRSMADNDGVRRSLPARNRQKQPAAN